jgi:hypothetical protein
MAVEDINDVAALSEILASIAADAKTAAAIGARGRAFALDLQREIAFPQELESILVAAASRRTVAIARSAADQGVHTASQRFRLTALAVAAVAAASVRSSARGTSDVPARVDDVAAAREALSAVARAAANGRPDLKSAVLAIEAEIAVAIAENERSETPAARDPLFRLHGRQWALRPGDLGRLVPLRNPDVRVLAFDHAVAQFVGATTIADLPPRPRRGPGFLVAYAGGNAPPRQPLVIDARSARILELSDGTRTASQIVGALNGGRPTKDGLHWIEALFVRGLISLRGESREAVPAARRAGASATPRR